MSITDHHRGQLDILCLGLYSSKYPAIGESHGLSIVAGSLQHHLGKDSATVHVLDMGAYGEEAASRAVELIRRHRIRVVAIGLAYGTYSVLRREYHAIRRALDDKHTLTIFGGPIATYLSDSLLTEVDHTAVVILGEADHSAPSVVKQWLQNGSYSDIPNLHYIDRAGKQIQTRRQLADLRAPTPPYREHVADIRRRGGQIFVETSRGCSWAACTFCLRGLTDIQGRSIEYRRKPSEHVLPDLTNLKSRGIREVTIADEDFLGADIDEAQQFVDELEIAAYQLPRFDVSLTVHSIFSRRDNTSAALRRVKILRQLQRLGMQKVFVGIESCSPAQLKRFAKGHTREEAVAAVQRLRDLDIRVEIGVILFDPLSTLAEIEDSLIFMQNNGLTALASAISSELRLQVASSYVRLLTNYERRHGVSLMTTGVDPDTLSIGYRFADAQVDRLFRTVRRWNVKIYPLYYPTKSLTRFGSAGAIGGAAESLRRAVEQFRYMNASAILRAIDAVRAGGDPDWAMGLIMDTAVKQLAVSLHRALDRIDGSIADHPVVRGAAAAADAVSY